MVDVHQPEDYPIILGDSLKDDTNPTNSHISFKYNWIPKNGLDHSSGTIKPFNDDLSLTYEYDNNRHTYTGWANNTTQQNPQLALFYDSSKSAFVLEKLAVSLDFNVKSSTDLKFDQIKRQGQIQRPRSTPEVNGNHKADNDEAGDLFDDADDGCPDPNNPFDYRNFIGEAKEVTEKAASHSGGGRTPLPGGRTPMIGLSSPLTMTGQAFRSTTPSSVPIEIVEKRKVDENPSRRGGRVCKSKTGRRTQTTTNIPRTKVQTSPASKTPKALSSAKVIDSDSDSDNSSTASAPAPPPQLKQPKKNSHHKNVSTTSIPSPSIIVNDGGLEIEEDSPPRKTRRTGYQIDQDAFRSQTGTPQLNSTRRRPSPNSDDEDIDMPDALQSASDDDDGANKFLVDSSDNEEMVKDGDVDDLVLDDNENDRSPSSHLLPPPVIHAPKPKRRQSSIIKRSKPRSPSPDAMLQDADDLEDDGGLAAELEAALSEASGEDEGGVGLGIGMGGVDNESDISEEE